MLKLVHINVHSLSKSCAGEEIQDAANNVKCVQTENTQPSSAAAGDEKVHKQQSYYPISRT